MFKTTAFKGFSKSIDSDEYGTYVMAAVDNVNSRILDMEDELFTGTSSVKEATLHQKQVIADATISLGNGIKNLIRSYSKEAGHTAHSVSEYVDVKDILKSMHNTKSFDLEDGILSGSSKVKKATAHQKELVTDATISLGNNIKKSIRTYSEEAGHSAQSITEYVDVKNILKSINSTELHDVQDGILAGTSKVKGATLHQKEVVADATISLGSDIKSSIRTYSEEAGQAAQSISEFVDVKDILKSINNTGLNDVQDGILAGTAKVKEATLHQKEVVADATISLGNDIKSSVRSYSKDASRAANTISEFVDAKDIIKYIQKTVKPGEHGKGTKSTIHTPINLSKKSKSNNQKTMTKSTSIKNFDEDEKEETDVSIEDFKMVYEEI